MTSCAARSASRRYPASHVPDEMVHLQRLPRLRHRLRRTVQPRHHPHPALPAMPAPPHHPAPAQAITRHQRLRRRIPPQPAADHHPGTQRQALQDLRQPHHRITGSHSRAHRATQARWHQRPEQPRTGTLVMQHRMEQRQSMTNQSHTSKPDRQCICHYPVGIHQHIRHVRNVLYGVFRGIRPQDPIPQWHFSLVTLTFIFSPFGYGR